MCGKCGNIHIPSVLSAWWPIPSSRTQLEARLKAELNLPVMAVPCIDEATKGIGLAHTASYLPVFCEVIVPYSTVFHQWFPASHNQEQSSFKPKAFIGPTKQESACLETATDSSHRSDFDSRAKWRLLSSSHRAKYIKILGEVAAWETRLHKASQGFTSSSPWVLQGRQPLECLAPGHPWPLRWKESVTIGKRVERVERVEMAWLSETLCISVHLCATEDEAFSANQQRVCWGEKTSDSPNLLQVLQRGSSPEPSWAHHPHLKRSARSKSARATMPLWHYGRLKGTIQIDLNRFVMQHPCPKMSKELKPKWSKMHLQQILWALQWVMSLLPPSGGGCTTGLPSSFCPSTFSWANLKWQGSIYVKQEKTILLRIWISDFEGGTWQVTWTDVWQSTLTQPN